MHACRRGELDVVQWLIFHGARIDASTPLLHHCCLAAGGVELVEFLISRGANVHAVDADGCSPLFLAARAGDCAAVRLFARHGARVDAHNTRNNRITPLVMAAHRSDVAMVSELLGAGAEVNRASDHETPLMAACSVDAIDVVDVLMAAGADANGAVAGRTPLHCAVVARSRRSLRRLLTSSSLIDVNDAASMNNVILATAVQARDKDAVAVLLAAGASVSGQDRDGLTPLLLACYLDCSPDMVALLLAAGSDHTVRERHHRGSTDVARSRELRRLIEVHVHHKVKSTELVLGDCFEELALLSHADRRLERERFLLRRARALFILIAMQEMHLPALLSVMIIDEACLWHDVSLHVKWSIATAIKHFREQS